MSKKPLITIIGFPEIERNQRALYQTIDCRLPDLLSLQHVSESDLILLDLRSGLPQWSGQKSFPAIREGEADPIRIARRLTEALESDNGFANYLGLPLDKAKLFRWTLNYQEVQPFLDSLISKQFGPPKDVRPKNRLVSDVELNVESPFVAIYRHFQDIGLLEKLVLSPLKSVYAQVWQAVAQSATAVIALPPLVPFSKESDIDDCYMAAVTISALYKEVVHSVNVREAPQLKPIPTAASSKNLDTAIDKILYGHVDYLGESNAEITIRPESGMASSNFSPQLLCPQMKPNIAAGFCAASVDKDGRTRSILVRCGLGSAVMLGGNFDAKGLAEYAVSCIMDPARGITVAGLPSKAPGKTPLVFTLNPCRPSAAHEGYVVRAGDKEIMLAMKSYLTLLAFAVAAETDKKTIDPAAPRIGGVDGEDIKELIIRSTNKTARKMASRLNVHFSREKLPAVIVPSPRPTPSATVYELNTSKYTPDISRLADCDIKEVKRLLAILKRSSACSQ